MSSNSRARLIIWPLHVFGPAQFHASVNLAINSDPGAGIATGPIGGSGLGDTPAETFATNKRPVNRGLVVGPKLFFAHANRIRTYQYATSSGSQNWITEQNFTAAGAALTDKHTGLYMMRRAGKPIVACAYYASATGADNWRVVTYEPVTATSGIWSQTNAVNIGVTATQNDPKAEIAWRNNLYFIADSADGVARWNPDRNVWKVYNFPTTVVGPFDFCPYQNKLWLCGRTAGGNLHIMEVLPTHIRNALILTGSGLNTAEEHVGRSAMWTDGTNLHLMYMQAGTTFKGFAHIVVSGDNNGTLVAVKDETQSIAYAKDCGSACGSPTASGRCAVFTDPSNEGIDFVQNEYTNKMSYAFALDGSAETGTFKREHHWEWNPGTRSSIWNDTGGLIRSLLEETSEVNTRDTGGERTHNFHQYQPTYYAPRIIPWWYQVITTGNAELKIRTSFDVTTNDAHSYTVPELPFPNGTKAAVSFTYSTNGTYPTKRAALVNPSGGSLFQNNRCMSIVAQSGTRYEVTIDLGADGVYDARNLNLNSFIAITGVP
jgi:hypothetical protein